MVMVHMNDIKISEICVNISAKDVPQVHWRRLQVFGRMKDALKLRKSYCTSSVQKISRLVAQTSRLKVTQEFCALLVHKTSRLMVPGSRLGVFPRVWQSTDMPISRLVLSRNMLQSTGCLDRSTGRLGRV